MKQHQDIPKITTDDRFRLPMLSRAGLRTVGRAIIWGTWLIVVIAAVHVIVSQPANQVRANTLQRVAWQPSSALNGFAAGFARAYLGSSGEQRVTALRAFTDRADEMPAQQPDGQRVDVVFVDPVDAERIDKAHVYVTVRVGMRLQRHVFVRYLTVPVQILQGNTFIVFDQPSFTAGQRRGGGISNPLENDSSIDESQNKEISGLIERFFTAYLSGGDIKYLLPSGGELPGATGNLALEHVDRITRVAVDANGLLKVSVTVKVVDNDTGTLFSMRYLLGLFKSDRWYVASIAG